MIAIRLAQPGDLPALFAYLGEQLLENGRDGTPLFQPMARTSANSLTFTVLTGNPSLQWQ